MDFRSFLLSASVAAMFVMANVLTKKSLEEGWHWLTWVVSLLAVIAFLSFRFLCQRFGLAVASGVVDSILTIASILIAMFFFKEQLSYRQIAGLTFIVVGIFLVK
jgi:multidrug transporter EmrE-like cation transporter